ncbi:MULTISPECIES: LacI family DNA-binding transcriptional regulator [Lachnospiraceae]|uniref:LacI family transcriptional regulator n=1 Tax=Faecalicatena acetigenes TaxID=2981790 RepID=A0ABT2TDW8_9FIRM|nr:MULTISPECIES: LacI family DNA-binding transcriptional regulator [Lachnospiraceae]MCU6748484.1 LacI family transcriptional regulator [Faecalicatena acetigenes]SCI47131.1 Catabolite control protein [uncultured Clostridium sp.]
MNIYDIAKIAGVSIATVSRVVNDSPRVSEKTKHRVRAVMEEYHYTPNVFARGLGLNSMQTIGIICPDVADSYMASAVAFLERRLREYGYDCILYASSYKQKKKEQAIELILKKRIDALVMVGSIYAGGEEDASVQYIRKAAEKVPVFLINGQLKGENIYSVYSEDCQATFAAASQLIEAGRKKILFLTDSHSYSAKRKMEGYETALRSHGLPVRGELKLYVQNQIHYVRDILLSRRDLEFDSVLATDDGLAVGAVKYAHAKKMKMPEELSVIGYNNSELSVCCEPELTTIDNTGERLCNITIDNMMRLLCGQEDIPAEVPVACHLVKRCTTDF